LNSVTDGQAESATPQLKIAQLLQLHRLIRQWRQCHDSEYVPEPMV